MAILPGVRHQTLTRKNVQETRVPAEFRGFTRSNCLLEPKRDSKALHRATRGYEREVLSRNLTSSGGLPITQMYSQNTCGRPIAHAPGVRRLRKRG